MIAIVASSLTLACSRTADLHGDVYVTMGSGDVKRAADVPILLVPGDDAFETAWKQELTQLRNDYVAGLAARQQAQASYEDALRQVDAARENFRQTLNRTQSLFGLPHDKVAEAEKRAEEARQATLVHPEATALAQHTRSAAELLMKHAVKRTRTDVNGHYDVKDIPFGKYYVWAYQDVFNTRFFWMVSIDLKIASTKLDLSSSNEGWTIRPPRIDSGDQRNAAAKKRPTLPARAKDTAILHGRPAS